MIPVATINAPAALSPYRSIHLPCEELRTRVCERNERHHGRRSLQPRTLTTIENVFDDPERGAAANKIGNDRHARDPRSR